MQTDYVLILKVFFGEFKICQTLSYLRVNILEVRVSMSLWNNLNKNK